MCSCIVKEKVGQGQPLNKGYNNATRNHNCYNYSACRKIVLKTYREWLLPICPNCSDYTILIRSHTPVFYSTTEDIAPCEDLRGQLIPITKIKESDIHPVVTSPLTFFSLQFPH